MGNPPLRRHLPNVLRRLFRRLSGMLFTGTFSRNLDEKLRLAVPKPFRETFGCERGGLLFLAPGTDGSLGLYAESTLGAVAERLAAASPVRQDVRAFMRLFYAQTQQVELDAQGRIRIPPELAQSVGLQKEVVLLGVQDHVELWSVERWNAYLDEKRPHYDEIAERAFDAK